MKKKTEVRSQKTALPPAEAAFNSSVWGSQSWLQPALRGGCAASQSRLKSRLQAELPAPPCCGKAALCYNFWLLICDFLVAQAFKPVLSACSPTFKKHNTGSKACATKVSKSQTIQSGLSRRPR